MAAGPSQSLLCKDLRKALPSIPERFRGVLERRSGREFQSEEAGPEGLIGSDHPPGVELNLDPGTAGANGFDVNQLAGAGVGFDLGATILGQIPAAAQAFVTPYIDAIVQGVYAAFSLAVAQTFYIGVVAAAIAAVAAAAMIEHPLRTAAAAREATPGQATSAVRPISTAE